VSDGCARRLRCALLLGDAGASLSVALQRCGVQLLGADGAKPCGAIVASFLRAGAPGLDELAKARPALGWRGRVFVLVLASDLARGLRALAALNLEPKRLLIHYGSKPPVALIISARGKPGGLVVQLAD
jgi:hypothetical protein